MARRLVRDLYGYIHLQESLEYGRDSAADTGSFRDRVGGCSNLIVDVAAVSVSRRV